ncbi:LCP family protein [Deinococcus sp. NW-56]|uniref:LCP family protein n=1 Tax=Deinococcus sp. NW-56 TaxID=2080419 RepID=UPI001F48C590|nr:LCP family protein [Deinococcus sp. NW-56]
MLLVLTLDPVARQLTLLSVPRDTRVNLPGHGTVKINAAYAHGGARLQTEAIERFLGLPMDKYVEISLGGFRRAIDEVGGVTVNPPFAFTLDGQSFTPGPVRLSGEQALAYARMRKQDPRGDLGRNARQQEVVRSLMAELGERSTGELQTLLERLQGDLRTNFSPTEVVRLRTRHSYLTERPQTETVRGVNRKIGGVWYYVVSDAERRRLHLELR